MFRGTGSLVSRVSEQLYLDTETWYAPGACSPPPGGGGLQYIYSASKIGRSLHQHWSQPLVTQHEKIVRAWRGLEELLSCHLSWGSHSQDEKELQVSSVLQRYFVQGNNFNYDHSTDSKHHFCKCWKVEKAVHFKSLSSSVHLKHKFLI